MRKGDLGKVGVGVFEVGEEFLVLARGLVAPSRRFINLAQIEVRQRGEQRRVGAQSGRRATILFAVG